MAASLYYNKVAMFVPKVQENVIEFQITYTGIPT